MARVLILFAHPALERSRVNRRLVGVGQTIESVTVHDLYETYPDYSIDVSAEQNRLEAHDVLILQHPFYWYSCPALMKEWIDLVFEHGWAFGHRGDALRGKILLNAITTGGPPEAYRADGYNRYSIRQLLRPFEQTANLCGMRYLAPFCVQGVFAADDATLGRATEEYKAILKAICQDRIDLERAESVESLSTDLIED
jgi:glutathione-regulated potassium-efflux system ancillary protein KefG